MSISGVATYEKPSQPAVGVQSLRVNGQLVVANGALILDSPGGRAAPLEGADTGPEASGVPVRCCNLESER